MIGIKIQCGCGQRYAFDVEPVNGRMPASVACPICSTDGTDVANTIIEHSLPAPTPPAPPPPASVAPTVRKIAVAAPVVSTATHGPTTIPGQMDRAQAEVEARAKVSWGDSQEEVTKFLMIQGLTYPEAQALVQSMFKERTGTIRKNGVKKIFIGIGMICVPIVSLVIFLSMGYLPLKLFAITVAIGLWGAWIALKGTIMMIAPKSEPGDVAEQ
jgi:hypothetical protein